MNQVDVAIVGAGAAGIAAGRRLAAAGRSIAILEARDRTGGRAHTLHWQGMPVDMGAAWLHFATDNAFTRLAEEGGFDVIRRNPNWGPDILVHGRSPTPDERERAASGWQRCEALITAAAEAGRDVALSDVLPGGEYRPRFDAVMTWAVGVESAELSTLDFTRYADSQHNWAVAQGLGSVVAAAADGLPVTLGATVRQIEVSADRVRLFSTAGRLDAGAVIVTIPTSLLAAGAIEFLPALPAAQVLAFEALPLGIVNKVFFRLPVEAMPFPETTQMIGRGDTKRTANYSFAPAGHPLIMAFFGGDLSRELENRHALADFARDELRQIFGSALTDRIDATLATGWGGDPFARGSYSAARPGRAEARSMLARSAHPRLHFAGEACSVSHYGTLHGAWQSGCAAADQVLGLP